MLEAAFRFVFHTLSRSRTLKTAATRIGLSGRRPLARRFVAGESDEEAIAVARTLQATGLRVTLDHLGESVTSVAEAEAATREYLDLIRAVSRTDVERNISLKLTQLGLTADHALCVDNLRKILASSEPKEFFIRIDMEESRHTDATLAIFETLWKLGHRGLGVVLQAALRRTGRDLERMIELGARVRLVKGAYRETAAVAFTRKHEVDEAFRESARRLLLHGHYPAIATHDETLIEEARQFAAARGIGADRFEFQMLYGIRRDLQHALLARGQRVRVYVPFGRDWFPYVMRRLGERPANVRFLLEALVRERRI